MAAGRYAEAGKKLEEHKRTLEELKRANPDVAIVIRPDRDLPVQKLIALMDALRFERFAVVSHDVGMIIGYALAASVGRVAWG